MVMTCLKDENALIVVFGKDDLWMAVETGLDGICNGGFTWTVLALHMDKLSLVRTDLVSCEHCWSYISCSTFRMACPFLQGRV